VVKILENLGVLRPVKSYMRGLRGLIVECWVPGGGELRLQLIGAHISALSLLIWVVGGGQERFEIDHSYIRCQP